LSFVYYIGICNAIFGALQSRAVLTCILIQYKKNETNIKERCDIICFGQTILWVQQNLNRVKSKPTKHSLRISALFGDCIAATIATEILFAAEQAKRL
jgi:hypothetical protein